MMIRKDTTNPTVSELKILMMMNLLNQLVAIVLFVFFLNLTRSTLVRVIAVEEFYSSLSL